jgi:hypothetical protein
MRDGKGPGLRVGRMIGWMAGFALFCWGATTYMVRAVAQEAPPVPSPTAPSPTEPQPSTPSPDDAAPGTDADTNEDEPADPSRGAAAAVSEELPEYRDSADNNISLPVDI